MRFLLILNTLFFTWNIYTQNTTPNNLKDTNSNASLDKKIIDSISITKNKITETYINENLSITSDDNYAKIIDSLWFNSQKDFYKENSIYYITEKALTTNTLKERLAYLDSKTPFFVEYNEILENIINSHLKYRKKGYAKYMAKAEFYFPLIEEQLVKHNIPLEMKYLVVVESALNPLAKSPVGATGLWQFIYQTGKENNLKVSSYVDERNHVLLSTIAACKYLNKLYAIFNDWDLALAAYNSGPGNVSKAIRRANGARNYWNIRHFLPRETASYVPLFYTAMYIFEYANEHGITHKKSNLAYFETDTITVKKQISFDQITQAINIEKNLLKFLNPQYKLEIIPVVKDRDYAVRLPKSLIGDFVQNENRIYRFAQADFAKREKPLPKYTETNALVRYKVKSGDILGSIANKFGVSVKKIMHWNNMKSTKLKIGRRLTIYPKRF